MEKSESGKAWVGRYYRYREDGQRVDPLPPNIENPPVPALGVRDLPNRCKKCNSSRRPARASRRASRQVQSKILGAKLNAAFRARPELAPGGAGFRAKLTSHAPIDFGTKLGEGDSGEVDGLRH